MEDTDRNRGPYLALILIAGLCLPQALHAGAPSHGSDTRSSMSHADQWFLVRMDAALTERSIDGGLSLVTGRAALDARVVQDAVQRLDLALPVSSAAPRDPERFRALGLDRTYKVHVPAGSDIEALVALWSTLPGVELAEPDYIGHGGGTQFPNDEFFNSQYGFHQPSDADVDAPEAWDIATGGEDIVIAVLDSGIDSDHPDLQAKIVPGFDFVNNDADPEDDHGHGTNVDSIVSASTNNTIGAAGSCWNCRLMPLKVLDEFNNGLYSNWADAMVWAADNGAHVINLSAGGISPSSTLLAGVVYAYDAGVIHVSITHNDDSFLVRYPGKYAQTITVGATNQTDRRADPFCYSSSSGSNYGNEIDVVAPGELILGAARGGGYNSWCGTSQAAPLVAGLVGIMRTINPSIGREEARDLLQASADDQVGLVAEDTPGFDIYHGWGRVNMERTLLATAASTTLTMSHTTVSFATPIPVATRYDFIRGDLAALSETAAEVSLGTVVCLQNSSPSPSAPATMDPPPGQGFFYLGRAVSTPGNLSYGGSSQNRDRQAQPPGGCS